MDDRSERIEELMRFYHQRINDRGRKPYDMEIIRINEVQRTKDELATLGVDVTNQL